MASMAYKFGHVSCLNSSGSGNPTEFGQNLKETPTSPFLRVQALRLRVVSAPRIAFEDRAPWSIVKLPSGMPHSAFHEDDGFFEKK